MFNEGTRSRDHRFFGCERSPGFGFSANAVRWAIKWMAALVVLAATFYAGPARAASYKVCGHWDVRFDDASYSKNACDAGTISEDYYINYDGAGNRDPLMSVVARNAYIQIYKLNTFLEGEYADSSGCVTFSGLPAEGSMHDVAVIVNTKHFFAGDDDTIVVGPDDDTDAAYGYAEILDLQDVPSTNHVYVGDNLPYPSLSAAAGWSGYRARVGVTDSTIRIVGCGSADCSSAHYDATGLNGGIARVRIKTSAGGGSDHRNRKFVVSHELGHAWALLRIGRFEWNADESFTTVLCCTDCEQSSTGYSMGSVEYNAIGAREGYAHFYAARVWNDTSSNLGIFRWFDGVTYDVECYQEDVVFPPGPWNPQGGHLGVDCNGVWSFKDGKSTNEDWMRFWWDLHTPVSVDTFSSGQLMSIYKYVQDHGRAPPNGVLPTYTVARDNYHDALRNAMLELTPDAGLRGVWDSRAALNGVELSP